MKNFFICLILLFSVGCISQTADEIQIATKIQQLKEETGYHRHPGIVDLSWYRSSFDKVEKALAPAGLYEEYWYIYKPTFTGYYNAAGVKLYSDQSTQITMSEFSDRLKNNLIACGIEDTDANKIVQIIIRDVGNRNRYDMQKYFKSLYRAMLKE